jgi:hypothetical protein
MCRLHPVQFMKWDIVVQLVYLMRAGLTIGNTMSHYILLCQSYRLIYQNPNF